MTTETTIEALNGYEGENLWEDVVRHIDGYDDDATAALDLANQMNVIALSDGTVLRYREDRREWVEADE